MLIQLLGEQWLIGVIQLILGYFIKGTLKDKLLAIGVKATGLIPLINVLIAAIGFQVLPVSAEAASFLGVFLPVKEGANVAVLALLQTVMVTGVHSTIKNTVKPVAVAVFKWAFAKLVPLVEKL